MLLRQSYQVSQREAGSVRYRVALTDGSLALQQQMLDHLPDFTLVLDILHATEYLWDAANARFGETASDRLAWVSQALAWLLENHLDDLLNDLTSCPPPNSQPCFMSPLTYAVIVPLWIISAT